jgi:O-antigen/teichoic acid export membrane protein
VSLRRNSVFGAIGFVVPTLVLLVAYPYVLRHLGETAMGLYLLSATVSGSLAFLEFGVSTATTKLLAERLAEDDAQGVADVIVTSLVFYGLLGVVGLATFWFLAPWLAARAGAGPELEQAAVWVLRIAALQFVPAYANGVLGSAMKGFQRFDWSTLQASALTSLAWGGSVAGIAYLQLGVIGVAGTTLLFTLVTCAGSFFVVARLGASRGVDVWRGRASRRTLRQMFGFGVFMAVNGIAGVLMYQVQTWLLAALMGAAAVTVYSTALQLTSKINGLMNAMFEPVMPVAAALSRTGDPAGLPSLRKAYDKAMGASLVLSVGGAVALYFIGPPFISFWLRSSIDAEVGTIIRILCVGLAVNGATPVAYHLMNGLGRPATNTIFMLASIALFYAILGALWVTGTLNLERFAAANSANLFVNGVAFLAFAEFVVWRRRLLPAGGRP